MTIRAKISALKSHAFQLGLILVLLAASATAGDRVLLRNGFAIECERHEVNGDTTRLYTAGGFVDIPTSEIAGYEHVEFAPAPTDPVKTIQDHVADASNSTGIDPDFLDSVIHQESGFNPAAVSPKGARGLMQLMPETAGKLGVRDSFDPAENVRGGAAYLRQLLELYHGDAQKALAAYNAGPQRVEQYKGVPPYRETQAYVTRIIREYNRKKLAERQAAKQRAGTNAKKISPTRKAAPAEAKRSSPTKPAS